jgi:hypothetical protein
MIFQRLFNPKPVYLLLTQQVRGFFILVVAKIYVIYKHTAPNGKAYIGQTKDYESRCKQHQSTSDCKAFSDAIKAIGWDNFTHEI